jgi:hypothetical protein
MDNNQRQSLPTGALNAIPGKRGVGVSSAVAAVPGWRSPRRRRSARSVDSRRAPLTITV